MVAKLRFRFLFVFVLVIMLGIGWQQVSAQLENARFFPETGHWVTDEFLVKYEEIPNPSTIYGAPITEAFNDPVSGRRIQYFEKVRFEFYPESPIGLQVRLSPLGEYLYEESQPLILPPNFPACRTFVESEYPVCYAFLEFFEDNGDILQFGYPISGFEIHDGWITQYFQNARLEWHPENPPGQWVTVANLGVRYFFDRGEDPALLNPVLDNIPPSPILQLRPHAFVSSAITSLQDTQTIYIIVRDQNHNLVEGAIVEFSVVSPDGSTKDYQASNTNEDGVSILSFLVQAESPGITNIYVNVSYGSLEAQTRTSFQMWW